MRARFADLPELTFRSTPHREATKPRALTEVPWLYTSLTLAHFQFRPLTTLSTSSAARIP